MFNHSLICLWGHIDTVRQKSLFALLLLSVFASFVEVFTIGAIVPFLAVITNPEELYSFYFVASLSSKFGISEPSGLVIPIALGFGLAALLSGVVRLILLYYSNTVSFAIGHDLSVKMYKRNLHQPYPIHVARNSSEVINAVSVKSTLVIFGIISPLLLLINSLMMLFMVIIFLIYIDPAVTFFLVTGFVIIYGLIMILTNESLKLAGKDISIESSRVIKVMQEGLGAIRHIIIDGTQKYHSELYRETDLKLRTSQKKSQIIREAPRYIVESSGLILITCIAYIASMSSNGITDTIPILGAIALGCQRMLPVVQNAYSGWGSIKTALPSLVDVVILLDQPVNKYQLVNHRPMNFKETLSFRNIMFNYSENSEKILNDISFDIPHGSTIGIIGSTGSGKSTLLDIIMGLLKPTQGSILVDGIKLNDKNCLAWQKKIGHVPQSIFLSDSMIVENIAFGVPFLDIDFERVEKVAKQAQLADTISALPDGYRSRVGERGVNLSGGQLQRIGIARALYKAPEIIIFDEATSALDNSTEAYLMQAVKELSSSITIVMVAHRLTTLKDCDLIYEIKDGKISVVKSLQM